MVKVVVKDIERLLEFFKFDYGVVIMGLGIKFLGFGGMLNFLFMFVGISDY